MTDQKKVLAATVLALLAGGAVLAAPGEAFAAVGGAGGDPFSGLLNWMQSNVVDTLITLGIILLGILLMAMRFSLTAAACICVGAWVMLNASTIKGWF